MFNWIGDAKLICRHGMTGATGNIYCGLHEFADMAFVMHLLRPGDLFVDVGANVGTFTVLASAVCSAQAIAVEPDPGTMSDLRRNIEINNIQERVTTIDAAIGAQEGAVRFTIGRDTVNRVADDADAQTREVRAVSLDSILVGRTPTLMKIDVEGYERFVLMGGGEALRNPALLAVEIETVEDETRGILEAVGFEQYWYEPFSRKLEPASARTPSEGASNCLFVRDVAECRRRIGQAARRTIIGIEI